MYLIYSMVLGLGLGVLTPWLLLRNSPDGRYTRFLGERFGRLAAVGGQGTIWLHAVSVGEALAVERLIAQLRQRFPARAVVLSVTTATGRSVAERRIEADRIFYFPLDFRFAARRALRA
ncbi:MAG TPA: glycosyltransferase N-terminal domain-containing protein, partial [Terriglobales bacterium]|nr:glycosyltransferase N-terminal domain-containing protein [Terriglobales bacterium]